MRVERVLGAEVLALGDSVGRHRVRAHVDSCLLRLRLLEFLVFEVWCVALQEVRVGVALVQAVLSGYDFACRHLLRLIRLLVRLQLDRSVPQILLDILIVLVGEGYAGLGWALLVSVLIAACRLAERFRIPEDDVRCGYGVLSSLVEQVMKALILSAYVRFFIPWVLRWMQDL